MNQNPFNSKVKTRSTKLKRDNSLDNMKIIGKNLPYTILLSLLKEDCAKQPNKSNKIIKIQNDKIRFILIFKNVGKQ